MKERIALRLSKEQLKEIKKIALKESRSLSSVVRLMIEKCLKGKLERK